MKQDQAGILYVVATPIGNLQDITLRAVEILKAVDKIAAEDTRHSAQLLKHYGIHKPSVSLHDFNERDRLQSLIADLLRGEKIALISDAGTPLISDPGFRLVKEAQLSGIHVVPIPGPCAGIAALSAAGLPSDRFAFEGFLPAKEEGRDKRLAALAHEPRTLIFYEAPHRLLAALMAMKNVFGAEREAVVARELTKMYESIRGGSLAELVDYYQSHASEQRGEIVILVQGLNEKESDARQVQTEVVLDILLEELPLKQAVMIAGKITGERKNTLYDMALARGKESGDKK